MSAEHDALMQEWEQLPEHKDQCFIRVGIIDHSRWERAPRKVLFILREAYDRKKRAEGDDLCQLLQRKNGPFSKTWWTVANWAYAALHGTPDCIPTITKDSQPRRREALLSTAVVNLKKSKGVSTSDREDILSYARNDAKLIHRQVELIDPQIVICGNTWKAARQVWQAEAAAIYNRAFRIGERIFIDYWHPANRWPKDLNYFALACILQNCGALT
jgi:hypothetical protein